MPVFTSASTAPNVSPSRTSVIVSSSTRSGGSSSKTRGRSSSISLRASESTSPLMLNASAASPAAGLLDRLAADAQPAARDVHPVHRRRERGLRAAVLALRPHVFVETTSQPASR
jgi:hypothetical protein